MTPEQQALADLVGIWDMDMTANGGTTRGSVTYSPAAGGRWVMSQVEFDAGGHPFSGLGLETFDPARGAFVSVWVDSMASAPVVMEGTADPATGARTLSGAGPGADGRPKAYRSVTQMRGPDEMVMTMYVGDSPEPMFVSTYTRR